MSNELKIEDIKKVVNHELREYHKLVAHPDEQRISHEEIKHIETIVADRIKKLEERMAQIETQVARQLKSLNEATISLQTSSLDKEYFYKVITALQQNLEQMINEVRGFLSKDSNEKTGLDKPV